MKETENDNRREQLVWKLLDSYFQFRTPLPEEGSIQENKTTLQIQDDLDPMMTVGEMEIALYMDEHGYGFITGEDGTVAWAVWRQA